MTGHPGFADLVRALAPSGEGDVDGRGFGPGPGATVRRDAGTAARSSRAPDPVRGGSAGTIPDRPSPLVGTGGGDAFVFVLVDGMGEELLDRLGPASFLARHRRGSLVSVFPSTTACAMTTLATGLEPARHGIPGRWLYLREYGIHLDTLAFRTRSGCGRPGGQIPADLPLERVWPCPSILLARAEESFAIVPAVLAGSPFAGYLCGRARVEGYTSPGDAVDRALRVQGGPNPPRRTLVYLQDLDSLCHGIGPGHPDSLALLAGIDREMERLARGLHGTVRLIVSADHGQIDVETSDYRVLGPGHILAGHLATAPWGEPRATQFLVKQGREDEFRKEFERLYGDEFQLLGADSREALALFGVEDRPGERFVHDRLRRNLGDFLALARGTALLVYRDGTTIFRPHRGEHGGNLPAERLVPLVVV